MDAAAITGLIRAWQGGDEIALEQLMPLVYVELQRLARLQMRGEQAGHTLQATALVNEAFIRLADIRIDYADRAHFLAMASRTMRRVLVDHARRKKSEKRGGAAADLTLNEQLHETPERPLAVLDFDRALTKLAEIDQHLADTVELTFFGGLSYDEAAVTLGVSKTKVFDDLKLAKAWLKNAMADLKPDDADTS